jgi:hypothetical protein
MSSQSQSESSSSLSGVGRKNGEPLTLSCSSARRRVSRRIFSERLRGRIFVMGEDGRVNEYKDLLIKVFCSKIILSTHLGAGNLLKYI